MLSKDYVDWLVEDLFCCSIRRVDLSAVSCSRRRRMDLRRWASIDSYKAEGKRVQPRWLKVNVRISNLLLGESQANDGHKLLSVDGFLEEGESAGFGCFLTSRVGRTGAEHDDGRAGQF
jgi:hypothetical protein